MTARDPKKGAPAATVEVFVTAFRSLTREARGKILMKFLEDDELREEVEAAILWEQRKDEPRRPFRKCLADRGS